MRCKSVSCYSLSFKQRTNFGDKLDSFQGTDLFSCICQEADVGFYLIHCNIMNQCTWKVNVVICWLTNESVTLIYIYFALLVHVANVF